MIKTKAGYQIPMDKIVSILLDSDQAENGLKFLRNQIIKHANGIFIKSYSIID